MNSKESKARIISSLFYNYDKVGKHTIVVYEREYSFIIQRRKDALYSTPEILVNRLQVDSTAYILYNKKKYRKLRKHLKKTIKYHIVSGILFKGVSDSNRDNYFLFVIRK
jgi:hypothetical protein